MHAERREIVLGRSWYWLAALAALCAALYALRDVLTPIFLAFTIAYILDPVVDRLERWRIPRGAAIALVLALFVLGVGGFLLLVVPEIARDIAAVARELPDKLQRWLARAEPWLRDQGVAVPHTADEWVARLKTKADSVSASQLEPVGAAAKALIGGTVSAIGAVVGALIVPILAVYLLADFDRLIAGADELIPHRFRPAVRSYVSEIDRTLAQFMRGQLTVMLILAVLYGGSYALLGVRLAIPIGIAAGVLNFVPYVGGAFALVAGLLMSAIGGGSAYQLGGVVAAYVIVQVLEGFVITPRIVGESVGLSEVWVLLALFVGGEIFGFLGVLLAVPAAAVLKIFVSRALARYRQSNLFLATAEGIGVGLTGADGSEPDGDATGPDGGSPDDEPLRDETPRADSSAAGDPESSVAESGSDGDDAAEARPEPRDAPDTDGSDAPATSDDEPKNQT